MHKIDLAYLQKTSTCRFEPEYGMDVLLYDGYAWGPPTTAELVEAVKGFPLDAADVLVTGYPKSGTNWMQIMLSNFYDDWGVFLNTGSRRVPSIDFIGDGTDGYDIAVAAAAPRLMKNHLPLPLMPHAWAKERSKIIYMTRNPFDVCVSFFDQLQVPGLHFDADWDAWVTRFANGHTLYGGWLDHVRHWHSQGPGEHVYHVSYEALRHDTAGEMRKVVAFLGKPISEARFNEVVDKALAHNMDKSGFSAQITVADLTHYRRSGQRGQGRAKFTPAQMALFDIALLKPLEDSGIKIDV